MALRDGLEVVPARSHKPITRVQLPLSQFDAGVAQREERLFRKQQTTGSRPVAGFRQIIDGLWGCRGWPPVLHTGKQPGSIPGRSTRVRSVELGFLRNMFALAIEYEVSL